MKRLCSRKRRKNTITNERKKEAKVALCHSKSTAKGKGKIQDGFGRQTAFVPKESEYNSLPQNHIIPMVLFYE